MSQGVKTGSRAVAIFIKVPLKITHIICISLKLGILKSLAIWIFVIIFLGTWLLGSLLKPFGPEVAGIRWMPFFLVGLVIFLILAAVVPRRPPEGRRETLELLEQVERERELEAATFMTLNVFFWILICVLVVTLIIRYVA